MASAAAFSAAASIRTISRASPRTIDANAMVAPTEPAPMMASLVFAGSRPEKTGSPEAGASSFLPLCTRVLFRIPAHRTFGIDPHLVPA
jgi:hypothetical protein